LPTQWLDADTTDTAADTAAADGLTAGAAADDAGPAGDAMPDGGPEQLVLVDEADREIGHLSKSECHTGTGRLHRAFSIFIVNDRQELLLQQRSRYKRLWPLYWSNSCCSHPRRGESLASASRRRLQEELGLSCPLQFLFKFQYQAQYDADGAEHELCSVFIGHSTAPVHAERHEIAAWRWIGIDELQQQLSDPRERHFTPWLRLEWARIWRDHLEVFRTTGVAQPWASR
jgi:isopentenyl-diphosphate Delta-isomerase